ncbi:hypothetical protein D9M70_496720 [compost metagenome]
MSHTPGPWTMRQVGGLGLPGQVGFAIDYNEDQEQVVDYVYEEADARLIAAAPDMFEALDNISGLSRALRVGGPDPMDLQGLSDALEEAVSLALSAIAKATGQ